MTRVDAVPHLIPPMAATGASAPREAMPRRPQAPSGSSAGHRLSSPAVPLEGSGIAAPRAATSPLPPGAPPAGEVPPAAHPQGGARVADLRRWLEGKGGAGAIRPEVPRGGSGDGDPQVLQAGAGWTPGASPFDARLGSEGLAVDGLHEVKPAHVADGISHMSARTAALGFVLRLARRRLLDPRAGERPVIFWCATRHEMRETGVPHAPGLAGLGLAPSRVLLAETARREDTLWAIEECLASGAPSLVVGVVDDIGLTPARRLALRAARASVPCLLLTGAGTPPSAATATRWRIAPASGAPHPFDPCAPGALRLAVSLERCRSRPLAALAESAILEWSDETHRFHMAAGLADRTTRPRHAARRAA